jgi:hypothetical protein
MERDRDTEERPELVEVSREEAERERQEREGLLVNRYPDWSFDPSSCRARLEKHLGVANLKGFGLSDDAPEIVALELLRTVTLRVTASPVPAYETSSWVPRLIAIGDTTDTGTDSLLAVPPRSPWKGRTRHPHRT